MPKLSVRDWGDGTVGEGESENASDKQTDRHCPRGNRRKGRKRTGEGKGTIFIMSEKS